MLGIKSKLLQRENVLKKSHFREKGCHRKGVALKTKDNPQFLFETIATLGNFDSHDFHTLCYGEDI